jgi:hypothetical protein
MYKEEEEGEEEEAHSANSYQADKDSRSAHKTPLLRRGKSPIARALVNACR